MEPEDGSFAPIPPRASNAAAPGGTPPRRINYLNARAGNLPEQRARRGARATPSGSEEGGESQCDGQAYSEFSDTHHEKNALPGFALRTDRALCTGRCDRLSRFLP